MNDPYKTLNVPKDASDKDIKQAFHKLALEKHPDRNPDPKVQEEFKEISAAYNLLSDPQKRQQYDQFGDVSAHQYQQPNIDLSDILRQSGFDFAGDLFGRRSRQSVFKGDDIHKQIQVAFMEAVDGCKKTLKVSYSLECADCKGTGAENGTKFASCKLCGGSGKTGYQQGFMRVMSTCRGCSGTGRKVEVKCGPCKGCGQRVKEEKLSLNIPAGIEEGTTMRLAGKGLPGVNGGPAGDLFVSVSVAAHPKFSRKGSDVYADEPIDYLDALLGAEYEVDTVKGPRKVKIPALTQPGMILRLDGQGVGKGHHYLRTNLRLPDKLNDTERALLEQVRQTRKEQ